MHEKCPKRITVSGITFGRDIFSYDEWNSLISVFREIDIKKPRSRILSSVRALRGHIRKRSFTYRYASHVHRRKSGRRYPAGRAAGECANVSWVSTSSGLFYVTVYHLMQKKQPKSL